MGLYIRMSKNIYNHSLSPSAIAKEFACWFSDLIEDAIDDNRLSFQSFDGYAKRNVFFVTFTFDKRKIARRQSRLSVSEADCLFDRGSTSKKPRRKLSPEFDNVDHLYKNVCRAVLGRNYHRAANRDKQPRMIAAVDVNGTRYRKSSGRIENVHIHSIWVLGNGQRGKFRELLDEVAIDLSDRYDFDQIRIDELNQNGSDKQKDIDRLSSYLSKFQGFNAIDMQIDDDVEVYPRILQ
ncbi:hypothetical protein HFO39_23580 [Rhizobium leguminosarum]|uniref:hypothetical protein n=1 Tax=Rhizobium leguminosarum TaxID=384 RepID=UPI001C943995|nr:hypothetical protein [Rhizobium leguminosarum]MBY5637713.1 hypothetical protein [Rhizobium leguminosarum]